MTSVPAMSTLNTRSDSIITTGGGVGGVGVGLSPPLLQLANKKRQEANANILILFKTLFILFINYNFTILN